MRRTCIKKPCMFQSSRICMSVCLCWLLCIPVDHHLCIHSVSIWGPTVCQAYVRSKEAKCWVKYVFFNGPPCLYLGSCDPEDLWVWTHVYVSVYLWQLQVYTTAILPPTHTGFRRLPFAWCDSLHRHWVLSLFRFYNLQDWGYDS